MQDAPQLHSSIVARVSPVTGTVTGHPDKGLRQLECLRQGGLSQHSI
jgi:hypothetical protein